MGQSVGGTGMGVVEEQGGGRIPRRKTRMAASIIYEASGGMESTNVGTRTTFLGKGHAARGARRGDGG